MPSPFHGLEKDPNIDPKFEIKTRFFFIYLNVSFISFIWMKKKFPLIFLGVTPKQKFFLFVIYYDT